jgi:ketosteroid isomerase-like protein
MSEGDVERLRSAYEAFNEGGVEAILERLDPEIYVKDRETMPDAATYHGREGFRKLFDVMLEAFDNLKYEVEDVVDRESHVVVVLKQHVRGRGSGISMGGGTVHVWKMRDGRAVALTVFGTPAQAFAALDKDR